MTDIHTLLAYIDPARLDHNEWVNVGMALKHEGATAEDFDAWSQRDSARYKQGEPHRRWASFHGSTNPVTAGTLVALAQQHGWSPSPGGNCEVYDWDSVIRNPSESPLVDPTWVQGKDLPKPGATWNPANELAKYLSTLFESSDHVGYVLDSWEGEDGRRLPGKGTYAKTSGEIIEELSRYKGDLSKAIGDYDPEVGGWIRFNPLDGKGIKDNNVTAYKYALVESDTIEVEKQAALIEELELPVAALVHSGGKSIHAIVRIGAATMEEYRDRVNYLHKVCKENGLDLDTQNKNPSRLSRMPGLTRNGNKQYLIATNQGRESFEAWKDYIEEANDNLPDFESLADIYNNLPDLEPELIAEILREGHKASLTGPSKAGKSFMLLQLALAIAEGREWLGWPCKQGRVLYINLELARPSCLHRIKDLYKQKGWAPNNLGNIELWNLRGKAAPMDTLVPKLIRRAMKRNYKAIIIDPIYKVITGDENAADKMAYFCNQFDRVCSELKAAVIYAHHHSKGAQGQKSARDRGSGSGVFSRDPDAILDIIQLSVPDSARKAMIDRAKCEALLAEMGDRCDLGQDDCLIAEKVTEKARQILGVNDPVWHHWERTETALQGATGWRMEGTIREFAPMKPREFWFRHPYHTTEGDEFLKDCKADGEEAPWAKKGEKKNEEEVENKAFLEAFKDLSFADGTAKLDEITARVFRQKAQNMLKRRVISKQLVLEGEIVGTKLARRNLVVGNVIKECMGADGIAQIGAVHEALKKPLKSPTMSIVTARKYVDEHPGYERNDGKITRLEVAE